MGGCSSAPYLINTPASVKGRCMESCPPHSQLNNNNVCACNANYHTHKILPQCTKDITCTSYYSADLTGCVDKCPGTQINSNQQCGCGNGLLLTLDGNDCVDSCTGNNIVSSANVCVCANGFSRTMDKAACVMTCRPGQIANYGECVCKPYYVPAADMRNCYLSCPEGQNISLDGTTCSSPCPPHSSIVAGACVCDSEYPLSADKQRCEAPEMAISTSKEHLTSGQIVGAIIGSVAVFLMLTIAVPFLLIKVKQARKTCFLISS